MNRSPLRPGSASTPRRPHVEVDRVKLSAFALADDLDAFEGDWHTHRFHQLLYAAEGALWLATDEGAWLLPPQRAAWISAGVRHRVTAPRPVALRTVYFGARTLPQPGFRCRVFAASPLLREMVLGAVRWDERWRGWRRSGPGALVPSTSPRLAATS
jgi:hypothetical protein